jgi:hypothetical protein
MVFGSRNAFAEGSGSSAAATVSSANTTVFGPSANAH